MEIELNIPETEITGKDISVETGNTNIAVSDDTKDLDITYNRKEYSIIGDGIFISSVLDDVPEWLGDLIESTFEAAILSRDQNLINRMEAILTAMDYVPKNKYTEQINQIVDEDGIINTRIATLNSNLTDAISSTNATVAEINLTYTSKDEAAAIATNVLTASLSGSGEIGSVLVELQEAYADLESTTAQSISMLESVMEGEINGNATAMETIRTYVGIDGAGASTGLGKLNIILNNIQNQVDGSISTWFYDAEPTLVNLPASEWTNTEIRNIHLGDIYYDRLTGFAYRFAFEDIEDIPDAGTIYTWIRITDSDITKALADAAQAQETADGKITTFYQSTPPTAEGIGDIWIDSDAGNKMYRWNGTTWGSDLVGTMVANAEAVTALEADLNNTNIVVGGHTTQLSTVDTRIADGVASVETKWAYNSIVNINGVYKKSGFGLTTNYTSGAGTQANPYVSEFWIDASRLKFTNSNQTGQVAPFTIDATGATPNISFNGIVNFTNTNIANGYPGTVKINGGLLEANTVTANKINTVGLIAENISANEIVGKTITGGVINGARINGAVIKASYLDLNGDLEVLTNYIITVAMYNANPSLYYDAVYISADNQYRIPSLSVVREETRNQTLNYTGATFQSKIRSYNCANAGHNLKCVKIRPSVYIGGVSATISMDRFRNTWTSSPTVEIYLGNYYLGRVRFENMLVTSGGADWNPPTYTFIKVYFNDAEIYQYKTTNNTSPSLNTTINVGGVILRIIANSFTSVSFSIVDGSYALISNFTDTTKSLIEIRNSNQPNYNDGWGLVNANIVASVNSATYINNMI